MEGPGGASERFEGRDKGIIEAALIFETSSALLGGIADSETAWQSVRSCSEQAQRLREGFLRARRIRRRMSQGDYWTTDTELTGLVDPGSRHDELGGPKPLEVLLQLIILSRIVVEDATTMPLDSIRRERSLLHSELSASGPNTGTLYNITFGDIVQAICDGRVRIGNPDQPDPYGVVGA